MDSGITVTGTGQASAPADLLRLTLSVGQDAADVAAAVAQVAKSTDAVTAALRDQGVSQADLQTSSVNVHPQYGDTGRVVGYRAAHTMTVSTRDLTGFGRLLNAAVEAAGNNLGLDFLQFDIEDKTALLERARELAFAQAREKADKLASLAGQSLGSIAAVSETFGHVPMRDAAAKTVSLAFGPEMSITPGEHNVEVTLEVRWNWS